MPAANLHIYCCRSADVGSALIEDGVALLDAAERERLDKFHAPNVRNEFVLSRMLLRSVLAAHLQTSPAALRFERDADNKPQLAAPFAHWHFNLSHGGEWIALALSNAGPVGIDIESHARKNNLHAIARRFFSAAENAALDSIEHDDADWLQAFFAIWTLKEAHAKALGCGLSKILSCSSFVVRGVTQDRPEAIDLQLSGIAASALPVATRLYRPAAATSLAVSQLGENPVDVALYRWLPAAGGTASSSYFELAPAATGNWRPSNPSAATDANPRA